MRTRSFRVFRAVKQIGIGAESVSCLILARVALKFLKFRQIAQFLQKEALKTDQKRVNWIRRSVRFYAHQLPWEAKCLEQSLATKFMLRRRGLSNNLILGVKLESGSLKAHAWIEGAEDDLGYQMLMNYEDPPFLKGGRGDFS